MICTTCDRSMSPCSPCKTQPGIARLRSNWPSELVPPRAPVAAVLYTNALVDVRCICRLLHSVLAHSRIDRWTALRVRFM